MCRLFFFWIRWLGRLLCDLDPLSAGLVGPPAPSNSSSGQVSTLGRKFMTCIKLNLLSGTVLVRKVIPDTILVRLVPLKYWQGWKQYHTILCYFFRLFFVIYAILTIWLPWLLWSIILNILCISWFLVPYSVCSLCFYQYHTDKVIFGTILVKFILEAYW